jgi:hypothetical protein
MLVCGGRHYRNDQAVRLILEAALRWYAPLTIIAGGARGADRLARAWADERGVPCVTYPANWALHGMSAGPIRNRQMLVEGKPDMVFAFPGGSGTADMVRQAREAGVLVLEYPTRIPVDR